MDPQEPTPPQPSASPPEGPRRSSAGPWIGWLAATLLGPAVLPALIQDHAQQDSLMGGEMILLLLAQLISSVVLAQRIRLRADGTQGAYGCLMVFFMIGGAAVGLAIYVISCVSTHPVSFH